MTTVIQWKDWVQKDTMTIHVLNFEAVKNAISENTQNA